MLFGAYQGYQDNSHKLDSLCVQYAKSEKVINMRIDSMGSAKKRTTNQHILTINGALTSLLNDYKFRNVIYKRDANNIVYYFTNGMLYSTKTDQTTGDLYFIDEAGQAIWCR